jgi:hypothetical protein
VGAKKIEKGKNINIPDVLKSEPDIDIKRRTLIGDTADSLAIRGFSGNRIMLNIDAWRPAASSRNRKSPVPLPAGRQGAPYYRGRGRPDGMAGTAKAGGLQIPDDSGIFDPRCQGLAVACYGGTLGAVVWAKPSGFCNIGVDHALDDGSFE